MAATLPSAVFHVIAWVTLLLTWGGTWLWCSLALPPYGQVAAWIGPQPAATVALFGTTALWLLAIRPVRARFEE